ncbi:hypothetical protein C7G41_29960 [Bradyrhizobium sp. MOS002]|nr:hypothetical protein C7G41_29960 [Bradyrhizobium sp. MOS002]
MRAQRSNPESLHGGSLDCFVASAPRNDEERAGPLPNFRVRIWRVCKLKVPVPCSHLILLAR